MTHDKLFHLGEMFESTDCFIFQDEQAPDAVVKKKRGRKPKSYYEALAAAAGGTVLDSPKPINDGKLK